MKKLNSKGSSPLHVVLILVIIGLIAGVGYYVYNSQKKTNESLDNAAKSQADPQKSDNKEETKDEKTTQTITHSQLNYSVSIPSGWTGAETDYKYDNSAAYKQIDLTSADFIDEPDEGYPVVEKGARIVVLAFKSNGNPTELNLDNYKNSESTYNGKAEEVTVAGQKAIKRIWAYEGSPKYQVVFTKDGVNYEVYIDAAIDSTKDLEQQFSPFVDEFSTVIDSFKFN